MPSWHVRKTGTLLCEWCHQWVATHNHHAQMKSLGGTDKGRYDGDPLDVSDPTGPVYLLCDVCHAAAHRILLTNAANWNCTQCRYLARCPSGQSTYAQHQSPKTLPHQTVR
jgi:hypothetical protein